MQTATKQDLAGFRMALALAHREGYGERTIRHCEMLVHHAERAEQHMHRARIHARAGRGGVRSEPDLREQARVSASNETRAVSEHRRRRDAECALSRMLNRRWTVEVPS